MHTKTWYILYNGDLCNRNKKADFVFVIASRKFSLWIYLGAHIIVSEFLVYIQFGIISSFHLYAIKFSESATNSFVSFMYS